MRARPIVPLTPSHPSLSPPAPATWPVPPSHLPPLPLRPSPHPLLAHPPVYSPATMRSSSHPSEFPFRWQLHGLATRFSHHLSSRILFQPDPHPSLFPVTIARRFCVATQLPVTLGLLITKWLSHHRRPFVGQRCCSCSIISNIFSVLCGPPAYTAVATSQKSRRNATSPCLLFCPSRRSTRSPDGDFFLLFFHAPPPSLVEILFSTVGLLDLRRRDLTLPYARSALCHSLTSRCNTLHFDFLPLFHNPHHLPGVSPHAVLFPSCS
jgi:hypothetical protein